MNKVAQDASKNVAVKVNESKEVISIQQRVFKEDKVIFHDLFKLEVAPMLKNMFWYKVPGADYTKIEHCHFFHTFDSSGKKQINSTSVGGHFHKLELESQGKDLPPKIVGMSGPLRWVRRKNAYGKRVKVAVPATPHELTAEGIDTGKPIDIHVHPISYLQSDRVQLRKINTEAALLIGKNAKLDKKPDGVDMGVAPNEGERKNG